jgi:hypothetical protein
MRRFSQAQAKLISERLYMKTVLTREMDTRKSEVLKRRKMMDELEQCTFKPKIQSTDKNKKIIGGLC